MPNDVFEEAFRPLHQRFRLPDLIRSKETRLSRGVAHEESTGEEDQLEMMSLLDTVASPTSGGGSITSRRQSNSGDQGTSEIA